MKNNKITEHLDLLCQTRRKISNNFVNYGKIQKSMSILKNAFELNIINV